MFGAQIKKYREQRGWTQLELARKVCVTEKAVLNWELDYSNPSAENMLHLAEIFSVSTDALYGLQSHNVIDISCLSDRDQQLLESMIHAFIQFTRQEQ